MRGLSGFDARDYAFVYQDETGNEYRVTFAFDLMGAQEADTGTTGAGASGLDYSQDQSKDLVTLRYDADYEAEVYPGVCWVPARALGDSRYSIAQIAQIVQNSLENKQTAVSTLYEALQLYQAGGFISADDNIRMEENSINWEHHKPGYYAVLSNCGCCATDSNRLHYILDGRVEIIYAQMNDIDLQILFDDPGDSLTFRFEAAPPGSRTGPDESR